MAKEEKKRGKVVIPYLYELREKGEPISWLTAYDFPTAQLMEQAQIEMILVGDSASMTVYGNSSTLPITMDTLINHCRAVRNAAPNCFVVGDMPFLSYQCSAEDAIRNAGRFMKEAGCDAVKLEGGVRVAPMVKGIVNAGIPVIGHIGLTPQSSAMLGGFKVQGKSAESAKALLEDALALQDAGAFSVLLECVPTPVSQLIKEKAEVLIFGIGAGPGLDGQLLILHDIIGLFQTFQPKFVKQYVKVSDIILKALNEYISDVKNKSFPAKEHEYSISAEELEKLRSMKL
ncbi:MAG: 3-methyl-2-oxobutanoate hydroxymethyltransferase [Planctomycetota bacterium]